MSKKVVPPFIRSPYNYDVEAASNEAAIPPELNGESMTVQSMAEDADLNVLMARFGVTGKMPESPRIPQYGDFSGINDFQSALNAIQEAQDGFMELTAAVRARFQNSPQRLLEFMADERNREEAVKLGLVKGAVGRVSTSVAVPGVPGAAIAPGPGPEVAAPAPAPGAPLVT